MVEAAAAGRDPGPGREPGPAPGHGQERGRGTLSESARTVGTVAAADAVGSAGLVDLAGWVRRSAASAPDRAALVAGDRQLTWSELDLAVDRVAAGLARAGMVAGYRVAIALPNTPEFVQAYFGALRAGLVAVPLDPSTPPAERDRLVAQVGARIVLSEPAAVAELAGAAGADRPPVPPPDPEALAVLLFTSGTSAPPHPAMLTHRALLANLEQMAAVDPPVMRADDVVLGLVPFCHVFGLNAVLGLAARTGATLVLAERFDPEATIDLVTSAGVTNVPAAPPVFEAWVRLGLADRLAGVRLLHSGAAPLPAELVEQTRAASGVELHEGYGLTEAAPAVSSTLCSVRRKPWSVGAPLPGVELRLAESAGAGADDPREVLVRGPNTFSGYWPDGSGGPDPEGWVPTGDLGYVDGEGDLFLVDRRKELILVSGFNVFPREVEDVIAQLPAVAEVAVVGTPDERTGEAVRAYVVPEVGGAVDAREVMTHCHERLARFKCPTDVEIVAGSVGLPRSVTGKLLRWRLREQR